MKLKSLKWVLKLWGLNFCFKILITLWKNLWNFFLQKHLKVQKVIKQKLNQVPSFLILNFIQLVWAIIETHHFATTENFFRFFCLIDCKEFNTIRRTQKLFRTSNYFNYPCWALMRCETSRVTTEKLDNFSSQNFSKLYREFSWNYWNSKTF